MKLLITVIIYALFIIYLLGAVLFFIGNKSGKKQAVLTASFNGENRISVEYSSIDRPWYNRRQTSSG